MEVKQTPGIEGTQAAARLNGTSVLYMGRVGSGGSDVAGSGAIALPRIAGAARQGREGTELITIPYPDIAKPGSQPAASTW